MSEQDDLKSKPESYWKEKLTPEQYKILRKKGTERAFQNEYNATDKKGTFVCAGCGQPLFTSETKYDSGSGWPSFFAPLEPTSVSLHEDRSLFRTRTEVCCAKCEGHLGHVFDDGPQPTGKRFCMNSTAMKLQENK